MDPVATTTAHFVTTVLTVVLLIALYFLPAIIARSKKKKNQGAIFTLNFLLGWTLIGWVIAIVWAETKD